MSSSVAGGSAIEPHTSRRWGWFVVLGLALIVLGIVAWADVVAVTIASTILIGAMMLVGGAFQIIHAFMSKGWRGFIFGLLCGVLYIIGGLLIMNEPVQGAVLLTLFLAAAMIVGGIVRIVLAFQHREMRAWGLLLLSGIVGVAVGVLLYSMMPWSGLWVLGTLVAVELIVQGFSWLYFGLALRSAHRA